MLTMAGAVAAAGLPPAWSGEGPAAPASAAAPAPAAQMGTLLLRTGVDGAPILLDGKEIGRTPLPGPWTVAPGHHRIVVRPPSVAPAAADFDVAAGGTATVELLGQPQAAAPAGGPEDEAPAPRVVRTGPGFPLATAGYVTAGVGLAALGAGTFFALSARSKADDARGYDRQDPSHHRADLDRMIADVDRADFYGKVFLGTGAVALLGGAALVFFASDGPFASHGTVVAPTANGAVIEGRF
jgi:hypothetical protein